TQPLVFSKADPHALYYANQYVYKTTDGGANWTRISDDLTRPEPGTPSTLDPATAQMTDRNGRRGVVYTIAPSPVLKPLLWVGSDDGLIQLSTDDGGKWINVTPSAINSWSRVTMMEASHFDFNEAYAAVDRHQLDDFTPHIYRTRDLGKSWQEIGRGLPPLRSDGGVTLRFQRGVCRSRSASARRLHAAHLPHARSRQVLAGNRARASSRRFRALRQGGSEAPRPALRGHGTRCLHFV